MAISIRSISSDLKKWMPVVLSNILIDLKLKKGQDKYIKFIVLGRSRTGSNFLRGLLNSHNQILCYGERYRTWDKRKPVGKDTVKYMRSHLFRKYSRNVKAVGFKLFYYHAQSNSNKELWKELKKDKSIHILHITRRNMLNTVLSRFKAGQTERWAEQKGKTEQLSPLTLPYHECINEFEKTEKYEKEFRKFFAGHKMYELVYENLELKGENEIKKVLQFLRVSAQPLVPNTFKQRNGSLKEGIANYNQLKERFAKTKWKHFFEE